MITIDETKTNIPPSCQVQTQAAAPYQVTFRIRNQRATSLFRYAGCSSELAISRCAATYSDQLSIRVFCSCGCGGDPCPTCGPCADDHGVEMATGAIYEELWSGLVYIKGTRADNRPCETAKPMPAGRYRVRLPLYASAADAKSRSSIVETASADFELPAAGGVVNININP